MITLKGTPNNVMVENIINRIVSDVLKTPRMRCCPWCQRNQIDEGHKHCDYCDGIL